jgi:uncharacterized protein (TIGR03435 family)
MIPPGWRIAAVAVLIVTPAQSQISAPIPKWEAISIKRCTPGANNMAGARGPGRMAMPCAPVEVFIHHAFLLFPNGELDLSGASTKVAKGPAWMYSDLYSIEAKAESVPGQPAPDQGTMQGPMLRALLAERFGLAVHRDSKQVPVYALTAGEEAHRLPVSAEGSCAIAAPAFGPPSALPPCGIPRISRSGMDFHGATMAQICAALSVRTDRRVVDKTGLAGRFDFHLAVALSDVIETAPPRPGANAPPPPPPPGPPSDPGETTALIQDALRKFGLRLEPAEGADGTLIIDHVERPGEN